MWPDCQAQTASSVRLRAPSLVWRLPRWVFTVDGETKRRAPISALVRPWATRVSASSSRSVRGSKGSAAARREAAPPLSWRSSRVVICGETRASPRAAARHRLDQQRGPGVLEQEAGGPVEQGGVDVLVEVEGGDDHDPDGVDDVGAGQQAGGLQPVEHRHADVEQGDVGSQPPAQVDRRAPVGGLAHDRHLVGGLQDHAEPGPHHLLVVGQHHPDGHPGTTGRVACTRHPCAGGSTGPAVRLPARAWARSAMPTRPNPAPTRVRSASPA